MFAGRGVKLMLDAAGGENSVKLAIANVEAVAVLLADIKVDFQMLDFGGVGFRQMERIVVLKILHVGRCAEEFLGQAVAESPAPVRRIRRWLGQFLKERGAVRSDRREYLWVLEGDHQRAVAAH